MSWEVQGKTGVWEVVMGLEVHAQILTRSKLFSSASAAYGGEANAQVNLLDAALPGTLPVCNGEAVRLAVRTALALGAEVHEVSVFERKNYFYADLPLGYQISQYQQPLATGGGLAVAGEEGELVIGIERLHMEQDAGKSMHDRGEAHSFVDLNRAGVPLMEIVSQPELRSPKQAGSYLRRLRSLLRTIGSCDGNMNEGSLRCDVNLSVRRAGDEGLGTRTETKNVNSVRFVMQAVEVEAARQVALLEGGGEVVQETRLFDPQAGKTRSMRSKEEAHDYRYFPDPDLLPLRLPSGLVEEERAGLPELPQARAARFRDELGVAAEAAQLLAEEPANAAYFEALLEGGRAGSAGGKGRDAKAAANWVTTNLFSALNESGRGIEDSPVPPERLGELLDLVAAGTISGRTAKEVFEEMWESGASAGEVVKAKGLEQISDTGALEAAVEAAIAANPEQLEDYLSGRNPKVAGWFVGQVMKATGGKANPQLANRLVREALEKKRGLS